MHTVRNHESPGQTDNNHAGNTDELSVFDIEVFVGENDEGYRHWRKKQKSRRPNSEMIDLISIENRIDNAKTVHKKNGGNNRYANMLELACDELRSKFLLQGMILEFQQGAHLIR
ncbi:MAG: hypothetical protein ACR2RF_12525 [Geminicoccaceae bacterium]